jgi:hypothetical protein
MIAIILSVLLSSIGHRLAIACLGAAVILYLIQINLYNIIRNT